MDLISTYFWSFRFLKAVVKADEDGESCNSIIDPLGQGSCDRQFASLLLLMLRRQFIFYFLDLLCLWSDSMFFYITTTSTITDQMTSFEIQSKAKMKKTDQINRLKLKRKFILYFSLFFSFSNILFHFTYIHWPLYYNCSHL